MSTFFIADLHLEESTPAITAIFIEFLKTLPLETEALYILGDLFEVWIGDDDKSAFHTEIISALAKVSARFPVFIMQGNRDFLIGKRFFKKTGAIPLSDKVVIDLYGTPTLLMHGDTLCTEDQVYLRYRKKIRSRLARRLLLWLPLKKRRAIADQLRAKSQKHQANVPDNILDVTPAEVIRVMQEYPVTQLIHGHTHRPAIHEMMLDGQAAKRIVLGSWHTGGHVLIVKPGNVFILKSF